MRMLCGLLASAFFLAPVCAMSQADAVVTLKGTLVSAGVGYEWGHGTVSYQGNQYAFCIRGLTVGDVGAAEIQADGVVFHMSSLDDFPGKYSAISMGAALVKGESSAMLKNNRGVTLQLESRITGIRFNISASGVKITMAGTHGCRQSDAQKR